MSSKLERDIEEVLAKVERFPPKRSMRSRVHGRVRSFIAGAGEALSGIPRPRLSMGQVLLLAIAVIIIAYVFGDSLGSSLVRIMIIGGIVTFIAAFIFSLRRQSSSRIPEKRWRGQPMDLDESSRPDSWWKRWRSRR